MNQTLKFWIHAMRLRTLPLSIAGILTGGGLAWIYARETNTVFEAPVFYLATLTALLLQILSNFANDYGDFQNGADNASRKGPQRAVQSGAITPKQMKTAILITALLAFVCGCLLLMLAFQQINIRFTLYLLLGMACIGAALKYTMGNNPYGYKGFGDVFVFLFFGLVACCGIFYLLTHTLPSVVWLPAISIGCWSTAVLNLNNLRDIDTDKDAGKITIPVRLGLKRGLIYHYGLLLAAYGADLFYAVLQKNYLLQVVLLMLAMAGYRVFRPLFYNPLHEELDKQLKKTALFTLVFTLLFLAAIVF